MARVKRAVHSKKHRRANRSHLFEHKPSRRTRRLYNEVELSPADTRRVRRLLTR